MIIFFISENSLYITYNQKKKKKKENRYLNQHIYSNYLPFKKKKNKKN